MEVAATAPKARLTASTGPTHNVSNGRRPLAPLWQQLSPKAKSKVKSPQAVTGASVNLASSSSLPSLAPDGALEPGKCSSPPGKQNTKIATGSSVAAARLLRASSSSAQIRTGFGADSQGVHCSPCNPDSHPVELETCPICLDDLSGQPLGVCLGSNGSRSCQHYFHFNCLRKVEGARCPQCRIRFYKRALLPSILDDEEAWYMHVSATGTDPLNKREVSSALKAMLFLSPDEIDDLVESCWDTWTQDEELHSRESIQELAATIAEHMPAASSSSCGSPQNAPDDESATLEDGHTRSGIVCSCGQVHVRRGDRVRRGPVPSEVDDQEVFPGQLGTIVRVGEGQETVTINWDRSPEDSCHCYIWPDPDGLVLAPAQFGDVAQDVMDLQEETGLSSMAAEGLLQRAGRDSSAGAAAELYRAAELSEELLRKPPKLYHRVRILPDKYLVQEWFDSVRPCDCTNARCSGGVQWSSRADKHLGREGCVLKVADDDDTVLVETRGPCQCRIWYPRLALEQVYDPDLAIMPQFKSADQVECKMASGWERGVVNEVLWRGKERDGPCPYSVKLDSGSDILVPHVNLIRKVAPTA